MILFLQFFLAHLMGDFLLQPTSWVRDKELKKLRSTRLYLHSAIHFALIAILTGGKHFAAAVIIALSHLLIDALKLQLQTEKNKRLWFFIDQGLHILILSIVAAITVGPEWPAGLFEGHIALTLITAIVFLLAPVSTLVRIVLSKWAPATEIKTDRIETPSLMHAGAMIGYLERILVFTFILVNQWAAIGFLITAKSVFRFSDLKIGQDRKLTEYILIGTLLSFGIAILTGILTRTLIAL